MLYLILLPVILFFVTVKLQTAFDTPKITRKILELSGDVISIEPVKDSLFHKTGPFSRGPYEDWVKKGKVVHNRRVYKILYKVDDEVKTIYVKYGFLYEEWREME